MNIEEKKGSKVNEVSIQTQQAETLAPAGQSKILEYEDIFQVAELAEKILEAENKIKQVCLKKTNPNDWVIIDGKPWLMASGAEKIAKMFGISWKIQNFEKQIETDKYIYTCKLECYNSKRSIEAVGMASSDDPFFSIRKRGKEKIRLSMQDVDEKNIKKKAYTNALVNGMTRMLGIRTIELEELERAGIEIKKINSYEYKKEPAEKEPEKNEQNKEQYYKDLQKEFHKLCLQCTKDEKEAESLAIEMSSFQKKNEFIVGKVLWELPYSEKNYKWILYAMKRLQEHLALQKEKLYEEAPDVE